MKKRNITKAYIFSIVHKLDSPLAIGSCSLTRVMSWFLYASEKKTDVRKILFKLIVAYTQLGTATPF